MDESNDSWEPTSSFVDGDKCTAIQGPGFVPDLENVFYTGTVYVFNSLLKIQIEISSPIVYRFTNSIPVYLLEFSRNTRDTKAAWQRRCNALLM